MIMTTQMKTRIFYILFLASSFISVHGQAIENNQIMVRADSVIQLGKNYRISYQYNYKDSLDEITTPQWNWGSSDYEVLTGPSTSSQTSHSITNGKKWTTYSKTYTFVLKFFKTGEFTLPPMTAVLANGETVTSKSFSVRVISLPIDKLAGTSSESIAPKGKLLVVEAKINKNDIVLGDSVECEVRMYTDMNVSQMNALSVLPVKNAFWKEYDLPKEKSFENAEYNGTLVQSILWAKYSIVPMQSGIITIEPIVFTATHYTSAPNVDPFEAFFNGGNMYIYNDTTIKTKALEIRVSNEQISTKNIDFKTSDHPSNVGVVIDRSSSLLASTDSLSPSFMELENSFVTQIMGENVLNKSSVTFFAGKPHYPTFSELLAPLSDVSPSKENDGSAIYDAVLASALREGALTMRNSPFSILLLTDGFDNASHISEPTLIDILLQNKIRVDVIAFASKKDSLWYNFGDSIGFSKIKNNQNLEDVERIAKATNGSFIVIEDKKEIATAIRKVKETLLKGETPKRKPNKDFRPEAPILSRLYEDIMMNSETVF
jgi:hypothetical protein